MNCRLASADFCKVKLMQTDDMNINLYKSERRYYKLNLKNKICKLRNHGRQGH